MHTTYFESSSERSYADIALWQFMHGAETTGVFDRDHVTGVCDAMMGGRRDGASGQHPVSVPASDCFRVAVGIVWMLSACEGARAADMPTSELVKFYKHAHPGPVAMLRSLASYFEAADLPLFATALSEWGDFMRMFSEGVGRRMSEVRGEAWATAWEIIVSTDVRRKDADPLWNELWGLYGEFFTQLVSRQALGQVRTAIGRIDAYGGSLAVCRIMLEMRYGNTGEVCHLVSGLVRVLAAAGAAEFADSILLLVQRQLITADNFLIVAESVFLREVPATSDAAWLRSCRDTFLKEVVHGLRIAPPMQAEIVAKFYGHDASSAAEIGGAFELLGGDNAQDFAAVLACLIRRGHTGHATALAPYMRGLPNLSGEDVDAICAEQRLTGMQRDTFNGLISSTEPGGTRLRRGEYRDGLLD